MARMTMRERLALNTAPIFLRLALGVVFLWAGFGKVMVTEHYTPEQAAVLGNYGVVSPTGAESPVPAPVEPVAWRPQDGGQDDAIVDRTPPPPLDEDDPADIRFNEQQGRAAPVGRYTAGDFPNGADAIRLHGITVGLHNGIYPEARDDGAVPMPLWFDVNANTDYDPWPRYFAWAVAISEILAGGFLVLGLLTRLGGGAIFGIMLGAMWLTEIGPAMQSGDAFLGFLPSYEMFSFEWQSFMFQLVCAAGGLALFFAGSGALALDRLVFGNPFGAGESGGKKD